MRSYHENSTTTFRLVTIYDLRNSIGQIKDIYFKTEDKTRPVKILDTYRTPSGLEIVKVKDIQTGLTFTIGQGSNPDMFTWMKNKAISVGKDAIEKGRYELGNVAGDDDWHNNIFGNAQLPIDGVALCRSEEHTSELQSQVDLVCRLLLEKKK